MPRLEFSCPQVLGMELQSYAYTAVTLLRAISPALKVSISFGCFESKLNCRNRVIHFWFNFASRIIKGRKGNRTLVILGHPVKTLPVFPNTKGHQGREQTAEPSAPPLCASSGVEAPFWRICFYVRGAQMRKNIHPNISLHEFSKISGITGDTLGRSVSKIGATIIW